MSCPSARTLALAALCVGTLAVGSGCSGGDDDGGGGGFALRATITGVDVDTFASRGLVVITYKVFGAPGTVFDIDAKYRLGGGGSFLGATPSPPPLNGPPLPPATPLTNNVIPSTDVPGEFDGVFNWYAGADLGFLGGTFQFQITPFSNGTPGTPNGTPGVSGSFLYDSGQPVQNSNLVGPGSGGTPPGGTGRASHTATNVRSTASPGSVKNLLVAGGYNDGGTPGANAFNTADRFNFDPNAFTHTIAFGAPGATMANARVLHASSFFLDPGTGGTRVLVTGGVTSCIPEAPDTLVPPDFAARVAGATGSATASIHTFSPAEQVGPTVNDMASIRYGHTATWIPSNQVVIIGGASSVAVPPGQPTLASVIEHYDPTTSTFAQGPNNATIGFPRVEHTATLLPNGRILVCGGYDPSNPASGLNCEIYNPQDGSSSSTGTAMPRYGHSATRLANGWVLIAGGWSIANGTLLDTAMLFKPENNSFDATPITMDRARALHAATLLGGREVLFTGGITPLPNPTPTAFEEFTTSSAFFRTPDCFTTGFPAGFSAASGNPLNTARAEHTATAVDCGTVFVIGGRNASTSPAGLNFLDSVEFYAFSNAVPVISTPNTSAVAGSVSTLAINFDVTDADADGGYVVVRFRAPSGSGPWRHATIVSQTPSSAPSNFANHEVCVGQYTFVWDFGADGVGPATLVDIQIIPFGAVIGSPVQAVRKTSP